MHVETERRRAQRSDRPLRADSPPQDGGFACGSKLRRPVGAGYGQPKMAKLETKDGSQASWTSSALALPER